MLASVGAVTGSALGIWGSKALVEPMSDQFPRWISFDIDLRFLAFTLAVTVGAALLFGLAPALEASANRGAAWSANRSTATANRRRGMSLPVTGEVALVLALLVVGGLSMLDVSRLGRGDPGFRADGLVSYSLALPSIRYADDQARLAFVDDYLTRLDAIPGVESAAVANDLPLGGHRGWLFQAEGAPPRAEDEANPVVLNRVVTPGHLETLDVELVAGRPFNSFDGREEGNQVLIVNETFVRTHLSHLSDPIGALVTPGTDAPADDANLADSGRRDPSGAGPDRQTGNIPRCSRRGARSGLVHGGSRSRLGYLGGCQCYRPGSLRRGHCAAVGGSDARQLSAGPKGGRPRSAGRTERRLDLRRAPLLTRGRSDSNIGPTTRGRY